MQIELLSITPDAEKLIERAGRICWESEDKITEESHIKFIDLLLKNGHYSVLEHASATFLISGISRACSHQLVRHRLASYSQRSQRYVKEDECEFVYPEVMYANREAGIEFAHLMDQCRNTYKRLIELGVKREDARYVLPNACCTEIVMTMNFRQWRHFLSVRLDKHAQWEIQQIAEKIKHLLNSKCSNIF